MVVVSKIFKCFVGWLDEVSPFEFKLVSPAAFCSSNVEHNYSEDL